MVDYSTFETINSNSADQTAQMTWLIHGHVVFMLHSQVFLRGEPYLHSLFRVLYLLHVVQQRCRRAYVILHSCLSLHFSRVDQWDKDQGYGQKLGF